MLNKFFPLKKTKNVFKNMKNSTLGTNTALIGAETAIGIDGMIANLAVFPQIWKFKSTSSYSQKSMDLSCVDIGFAKLKIKIMIK